LRPLATGGVASAAAVAPEPRVLQRVEGSGTSWEGGSQGGTDDR